MSARIITSKNGNLAEACWYVGIRFFAFLLLLGSGMGGMYFADNIYHLLAVGITYLIAATSIIVVILADQFERDILRRLRRKR